MPLSGSNKKEYQREYMQRKRSNKQEGLTLRSNKGEGVTIGKEKAITLMKIASSLDREIQGLGGRENMLDLVRYGDYTMRQVRDSINAYRGSSL